MMDYYVKHFDLNKKELTAIIEKYTKVYTSDIAYSEELKEKLLTSLKNGHKIAAEYTTFALRNE